MNILAIDIGGTHIKFRTQKQKKTRKVDSGPKMDPAKMLGAVFEEAHSWDFDHVSVGYPGPVVHDLPVGEPNNLAPGWVAFDWKQAFEGKPYRMMNDASMQALGSYQGGRMLFLGLGTGFGSAMIVDGVVEPMELAHLPWRENQGYEDLLGQKAFKRDGKKVWRKHVSQAIKDLSYALQCEYVVLGGGNAEFMGELPKNVILSKNENAILGGLAVWHSAINLHRRHLIPTP
jgi:polyphosphate glucokinase